MKDIIFRVFTDVWRLMCRYQFRKLDDTEWEAFLTDGEMMSQRYREQGTLIWRLFRGLFSSVREYYESAGKEDTNGK